MLKICQLCGEKFETNRAARKLCYKQHYRKCKVCGKEFPVDGANMNKMTCSKACMKVYLQSKANSGEVRDKTAATNLARYGAKTPAESDVIKRKAEQTNMGRYGVAYPMQAKSVQCKAKETSLKHYGVEHPSQAEEVKKAVSDTVEIRYGVANVSQSEEVKASKAKSYMERYGVDNPMKSECVKDKYAVTCEEHYGVPHPMQSEQVKEKVSSSMKEHFGTDWGFQSEEVKEKIAATNSERYGTRYASQNAGVVSKIRATNESRYGGYTMASEELREKAYATMLERYGTVHALQNESIKQKMIQDTIDKYGVPYACMLPGHFSRGSVSKINLQWKERLEKFGIRVTMEKPIGDKVYDLCYEDSQVVIEIDPTITHNSYMSIYDKTSNGLDKNYHLDKSRVADEAGYRCVHVFDWDKVNKVLGLFYGTRKVLYARNLEVVTVDYLCARDFLNRFHLQCDVNGKEIAYGLTDGTEIFELMVFGKPRYNHNYQVELLRLCTNSSYMVVGGAEKLFKHFITTHNPKSVISYCDAAKFRGGVYERIGMNFVRHTPPAMVWSYHDMKITDNLLRQRGYDQLFGTNFGKGASNFDLMVQHGWLPVYDCGQKVYEYLR